jgi:glycosyltransferase involved in cell wall biosynthesis
MSTKLSIIVPIYNSEKHLHECLKSICNQINSYVEVILINDCSNDSSKKICNYFLKRFNSIKLINLKKNKGVSFCRNLGVKYSNGKYLCFVDSDDWLLKGSINNFIKNINNFKEKDLYVLRYLVIGGKENFKKNVIKNQIFESNLNKSIINNIKNANELRLTPWNFIIKKDFLISNKIFFKNIKLGEDWIFVSEILCLAKSFKVIKNPTYVYRIFYIDSLGKSKGFIYFISRIKVICELAKYISKNKNIFSKDKIRFLFTILKRVTNEMLQSALTIDHLDLKKAAHHLQKYKSQIQKVYKFGFLKFSFLINNKKNVSSNFLLHLSKKTKSLKEIIKKLEKNKLIIFCAGNYGRTVWKYFDNNRFKIKIIVDNNLQYKNQKIGGIKIRNPIYLKKNKKKLSNYKILICNRKINEVQKIISQIKKIGYESKNIHHFNEL